MESPAKDIRFGLRALRKNPGFTALAILALALGIGANTAIFSVVYSLMFRPLQGAEDSSRLVTLGLTEETSLPYSPSYLVYQDYRSLKSVFVDAAGFQITPAQLRIANENPERIMFSLVSGNYFDVLGVKMAYGRKFTSDEAQRMGAGNVVVLGYKFWKLRFNSDPGVVGSIIRLNGNSFTVIGIASAKFSENSSLIGQTLFVPVTGADFISPEYSKNFSQRRGSGEFNFIGRLREGVNLENAQSAVTLQASRLEAAYPDVHKGQRAIVYPEPRTRMEPSAAQYMPPVALIFMTLVGLVLLAACANVAGLFYARSAGRQKEIAIRLALGAGRWRILRQLITESLLLSIIGAIAGIFLARWLLFLLSSIRFATDLKLDFNFALDTTVLTFSLLLAVFSGLLSAITPGLRISTANLAGTLKEGGKTSSRGTVRQRLRDALVVVQVAVSLVLLVCSGLFLRATQNAAQQDLGIQTTGRLIMATDTELIGYDESRNRTFYRQLLQRVRNMPGVERAALGRYLPIGFRSGINEVFIEGRPSKRDRTDYSYFNIVSTDYFETVGTSLLQGRVFSEMDQETSKPVAIINQAMANRYWPDQNPIGKRFRFDDATAAPVEVVGIVKTVKFQLPAEKPTPGFYLPFDQNERSDMVLHVQTIRDPKKMIAAVRTQVLNIDPEIPLWDARTLEEHIRYGKMRLYDVATGIIGGFGLIALALAGVGLYGVMAFLVNQRMNEIGIRMALGASRRKILNTVFSSGIKKTLLGLVLGAPLAFIAMRAVQYLMVGVSPNDPWTILIASTFLIIVTLLAVFVPAWRATQIDPVVALRNE